MKRTLALAAMLSMSACLFAAPPEKGWVYEKKIDRMTDRPMRSAEAKTAPLPGLQGRPSIGIVSTAPYRLYVLVTSPDRPMYCPLSCTVRMRFDDGDAVPYDAKTAPNSGGHALMLDYAIGVVDNLRTARRVRIEVSIAGGKTEVLDFTPGPLDWPSD